MSEPKTAEVKSGDLHTLMMDLIREDIQRQHPDAFTEDNDSDLIIQSGPERPSYVKIDTSALAEAVLPHVRSAMLPASPPAETGEGDPSFLGHLIRRSGHASIFIEAGEPIPLTNSSTVSPVYDGPQNVTTQPVSPSEGGAWRRIGQNITMSPFGEDVGNAVISPEEPQGPYWTLIAQGGEAEQNAIGDEIVRRLNATHPASDQSDTERMRAEDAGMRLREIFSRHAGRAGDSTAHNLAKSDHSPDAFWDAVAFDFCAALAEKAADQSAATGEA